jgi:hypothetical protein
MSFRLPPGHLRRRVVLGAELASGPTKGLDREFRAFSTSPSKSGRLDTARAASGDHQPARLESR